MKKIKELAIAMPNKILLEFKKCINNNGIEINNTKLKYLYYRLFFKKSILENNITITINGLCKLMDVNSEQKRIKALKERLLFLEKLGYIKNNCDLKTIKKNEEFEIEFILDDNIYEDGFTFINKYQYENFLKLKQTTALIYLFLLKSENSKYGYAFCSMSFIQINLKIGTTTMQEGIKELIELGLIEIKNDNYKINLGEGKFRNTNNRYYISKEKVDNNVSTSKKETKIDESKKELDLSDYNVCPF